MTAGPSDTATTLKTIYEVDLEPIINAKQSLYKRTGLGKKHILIAGDITTTDWVEKIPKEGVLFTLEGILPYMDEEQVSSILANLATCFRHSHILAETLPSYMTASAYLSPRSAIARWLLLRKEDSRESFSRFLSDHSVLSPAELQLWAPHLPSERVHFEAFTSPTLNIPYWKIQLLSLLGVDHPRISWLSLH